MTYDMKIAAALRIYADEPMEDGDAVLLLDDSVCLEMTGLADHRDAEMQRNVGLVLTSAATRVVLAIARRGAELTTADYALWRDLHAELRDTDVALLPIKALPAA